LGNYRGVMLLALIYAITAILKSAVLEIRSARQQANRRKKLGCSMASVLAEWRVR
jgi:hypothetical protein